MNPFVAVLDSVDNLLFSPPASPMSASAKRSGPVRVALIGAGLFAQGRLRRGGREVGRGDARRGLED